MSSFGTIILLKVFPALLPPIDEEDRDFYEILGLSRGASESEIRKAYKTKSLALHPDKIAQRGESVRTAEEAAKEYQLVQEAHTCLSDKSSRQKYHAVQCSPTRYRFLTSGGGLSNQMALLKNLSQASFGDKTRLVLFVSIFPALLLIQPILIAVKVNHVLKRDGALEDASWMALLIPWWLLHGSFVIFWFVVSFIAPAEAKLPILSTAVEWLLWLVAFVLLALRWDGVLTADYAVLFIPVYLAIIMKWVHAAQTMHQISKDMSKMVSKDHFLNVILQGREPEELEEEELKELHDKYVVVSQIPADVEHELENDEEFKNLSDEEKEEIRVSSSREFDAALEAYGDARRSIVKSMALDVAFLVLLILKVDVHVPKMSWWFVFLPILLSYGLRIMYSCFICCCLATPMDPDEVIVLSMTKQDLEKKENGNDAENENGANPTTTEEGQDDNQDGAYSIGSEVILHSLNTAKFYGKTGIIKGPIKAGRQEVFIEEENVTVSLKVENLKNKDPETEEPATANSDPPQNATTKADEGNVTETKEEQSAPASAAHPKDNPSEEEATKPPGENGTSAAPIADATPPTAENENSATPPVDAAPPAAGAEGDDKDEAKSGESKDGDDKDDDEGIHIDPETYRAYQSAYAAAEQNVMEDRVKAGQDNCVAIMKVTMVCLLVAKLEQAYEAEQTRDEEGDDVPVDVGFNTLWLIFPLFVVAGFMIFCCACLIYGAPDPDELMQKDDNDDGDEEEAGAGETNNQGETSGETPIVFAPPPPPPTADPENAEAEAPSEEAKSKDEAKKPDIEAEPAAEEEDGDINDLD